jgi:hypothetical protein
MQGTAYALCNASVTGLMFGPCTDDLPVGRILNLTVRLRAGSTMVPFLTYEVSAVVVRSRHCYVAARYEFTRPGEESLVRQHFARMKQFGASRPPAQSP